MNHPRFAASSRRPGWRLRAAVVAALLMALLGTARAQLSGTYTIGGDGASYASIEAAISALVSGGVNGAVMFSINSGNYTPPSDGYLLPPISSMSATYTVTFKPASGATVAIAGSSEGGVFRITGHHYILDGSNTSGGTTRNWQIVNRNRDYSVVAIYDGAQYNTIKNLYLINSSYDAARAIVSIGPVGPGSGGTSYNTISGNTLGDSTGSVRSVCGVFSNGQPGDGTSNVGNRIEGNDIINVGLESNSGIGVYIAPGNRQTMIRDNRIRIAVKDGFSGETYGILFDNSEDSGLDSIADNRIWNLSSTNADAQQIGMFINSTSGSSITIHDNMISLMSDNGFLGGLQLRTNGGTAYLYYNSVHLGGSRVRTGYSDAVRFIEGTSAFLRNNALVNRRGSRASESNTVLFSEGNVTLNSNNNLLWADGNGTVVGYDGSNYRSSLANWQTTGNDVASVTTSPRFIDPRTGDLHISTNARTPVEGRGVPISGITADIDGNSRNGSTPDIGADEGSFLPLVEHDIEMLAVNTPVSGVYVRSSTAFAPVATVLNIGTASQTGVAVRFQIVDVTSGTVVYDDARTTGALASFDAEKITFGTTGSIAGSTSLSPGEYRFRAWVDLGNDGDRNNDSMSGTMLVKSPLNGRYTIDPGGSGARNYRSFTEAAADLSQIGIDGAVTMEIAGATFDASVETFPITIGAIQGAGSTATVTFVPASGAYPVVDGTMSLPLFDLAGADYVRFDGSNSGNAVDRNWTIVNRGTAPAILFRDGAQNNVVENMYILGSPYAPLIHIGEDQERAGGNSNNVIASSTLGDSTGRLRANFGVYMYGVAGSQSTNTGNRIEKNEIINFGTDFDTGFGVYVDNGNARTKISGNSIHIPVKDGGSGGAQGILFASSDASELDTISYNSIRNLSTSGATAALAGIQIAGQSDGSSMTIHDNMISIVADRGTINGIVLRPGTGSDYLYNNSVYIGGSYTASTTSYALRVYPNVTLTARNNILANARTSTGSNTNRVFYRNTTATTVSSDHNVLYADGASTTIGYDGSSFHADIASWQGTGLDANSVSGRPPFVDARRGDLHLELRPVFTGESAGIPIADEIDIDGNERDAVRPDIGADEGDFNGGGIGVIYPNGGENLVASYETTARFRTNRPMRVIIELSTDDGATWEQVGSVDETIEGENEVTVPTPATVTSNGRLRVVSTRNQYEADTSDNRFNLVNPIVTVVAPDGGERWIAGDTLRIRWTSEYMPATLPLTLELSTDNGSTWSEVKSGLLSENLPASNGYDWVVPNVPTDQALIRVMVPQTGSTDRSNMPFTIIEQPRVELLSPMAGARWYAGDRDTIRWTSVTTDNVTIEYSLDGGATWTEIMHRIPAYLAAFPWTVPNTRTTNAMVRIFNNERPRYDAVSGAFSILKSQVHVTAPNGGEEYELNAPVTVTWTSSDVARVRIEYSTDNGITWRAVASGIDASLGTATFTPPQLPTKTAAVRVVDEDRPQSRDASDAPFEILQPKSITLFTPATGDGFGRNSTTVIYWRSVRLSILNIYYSSNGGSTWSLVASNVPAPAGTYTWTVPNQNTENGKIRLVEVLGDLSVESGRFSIVDPATPTLRVISPNGGEVYTVGDMATILWSASGITTPLTISYSSDGGSTWNTITNSAQPGLGQYLWNVPDAAGTAYRIRVSAPTVSDASDASFTIKAQPAPKVVVTAPNGGETFTVGTDRTITWTAQDVFGSFAVAYSTDGGTNWTDITTVPANASGNGSYSTEWRVPNTVSVVARVRVMATAAQDVSDGVFEIRAKAIDPIVVTSPNGGEMWTSGDSRQITWTAPAEIVNVKIDYSLDGGTTWTSVTNSTPNDGSHDWTVTNVTARTTRALVRVYDVTDGTRMDASDAEFTISPKSTEPLRVLTPNGGEVLTSGTAYQVTFSAPADVAGVWVYFSRDGGTNWEPVAGPIPAASGSYAWQVPTVASRLTTAMIRVVDAADANRKDESDATFTIDPAAAGVAVEGAAEGRGIMLLGNFPNPFIGSTEIRWTQGVAGETSLRLVRASGTTARDLRLGTLEAGAHSYELPAGDLPSGSYYYELRCGATVARGMMVLTR